VARRSRAVNGRLMPLLASLVDLALTFALAVFLRTRVFVNAHDRRLFRTASRATSRGRIAAEHAA
jgi:hypothetical protein